MTDRSRTIRRALAGICDGCKWEDGDDPKLLEVDHGCAVHGFAGNAYAALDSVEAERERDRRQIAQLTETLRKARVYVSYEASSAHDKALSVAVLAEVDAVLAGEEDARPEEDVTEGLPREVVRLLRDPTFRVPQDDYKLADGRTLWEHLQEWRNAPSDTASADLRAAGEGDT